MAKAVGELQDQRKGRHKLLGTRSEGEMVGMEGRGQSQEAERRENGLKNKPMNAHRLAEQGRGWRENEGSGG